MISVILPVYNSEKFIFDSVLSIINQTYADFELLILDDGSTDCTLQIIKTFDDSRIKIYNEPVNKGIVFQLNKGISLAKGEYIARMDADDISLPNRFQMQINYLKSNPEIEILGCQAEMFGDNHGLIKYPVSTKCIDILLNYYCCILHPSVLMRSTLFSEKKYCYENIKYAEDYHLWNKISDGKNIANLDSVLIKYRIHAGQTNKMKFEQQYQGALLARQFKLKKTFKTETDIFINEFNQLANDYTFYGYSKYANKKFKYTFFKSHLNFTKFIHKKCRKPIVNFVWDNLFN